jgi:hypothetical protein
MKELKNLELDKLLRPTRGIKHWGISGYAIILPRIKFGVTGQDSSSETPNDFIPPTVVPHAKKHPAKQ